MSLSENHSNFEEDIVNPFEIKRKSYSNQPQAAGRTLYSYLIRSMIPFICFVGLICLWMTYSNYQETIHPPPLVYVEIKALNERGHPVAGAQVKFGNISHGLTDAFGEWRRYLRFDINKKVSVRIVKESPHGNLVGGEVLKVKTTQMKPKEHILKSRIRLRGKKRIKRAKAYFNQRKSEITPFQLFEEFPNSIAINLHQLSSKKSHYTQHYFKRIKEKVLPEVKNYLVNRKIEIDPTSNLRLNIGYIPFRGRSGFIRGDITWTQAKRTHTRSFLRNFLSTPQKTAQSILSVARAYIPYPYKSYSESNDWYVLPLKQQSGWWSLTSGEILTDGIHFFPLNKDQKTNRFELITQYDKPCEGASKRCVVFLSTLEDRPPQSGWNKFKLSFASSITNTTDVYVAGFSAWEKGPKTFEYWGKEGTAMNLTIVQKNKIILRQKIIPRNNRVPTIMIPKMQLAHR